ncbi:Flagellar biosynthesis protein FlhF OS=Ureibacillus acetophenoni OX=614649 GN=SAMN05877842_101489 PE=3 SV=1 [Ureibacillus acetophenoni]
MKMKKYIAPSIAEAMKSIRAELGEDAVIINSKVIETKKFFGLVKQKHFEVLAGVDQIEIQPKVEQLPDFIHETKKFTSTSVQNETKTPDVSEDLKKELADLKSMLKSIQRQSIESKYPEQLLPIIEFLRHQELNEELITEISDELFAHYEKLNSNVSQKELWHVVESSLRTKLKGLSMGGIDYDKKFINVIGPTGVGKTTTIAKIAARAVLEKKKKIGFITTDTYRIAAIEQLKTYANLLQAPIEIVYNSEDYKNAIEKLSNLDLIMIDTAGRNYKEEKYVNDLKQLINFDEEVESFLLLSLTSKEKDMEKIIDQFKDVPFQKFIFTKIDETNSIGTMYNLMIKYNKGLAYYTDGQEVPEDIKEANLENLLDIFFQGEFK